MASISRPMVARGGYNYHGRGSVGPNLRDNIAVEYRQAVGMYLRDLRENAQMTQADVATLMDVHPTHISAIEHGRVTLPPDKYDMIVQLYDLDAEEFGRFILRFTNPWLFAMIYGISSDRTLKRDLQRAALAYVGTKPPGVPTGGRIGRLARHPAIPREDTEE